MKLMMHPQHGWHRAHPQEEAAMRLSGWVDVSNAAPPGDKETSSPSVLGSEVGAAPIEKRKPGRPRKQ